MNYLDLLVTFENHDLTLVIVDDERYLTLRGLAQALDTQVRSLQKLVQEMRDKHELKEGVHLRCIPMQTAGGKQPTTLVTYRGIIRIAMSSHSPRAAQFRDWAEDVLFAIMTNSGPDPQTIRALVEKELKAIGNANQKAAQQACELILSLRGGASADLPTVYRSDRKDRGYVTAIEWVKKYYPGYAFPRMNSGGRLERLVVRRHLVERGHWPEHDGTNRLHAWIYSERYDREFLEQSLQEFLKRELPRIISQSNAGNRRAFGTGEV
jgi:prophage antirepressor-like protein